MAILREHLPWYKEVFQLPGFFAEPLLTFGYQDICIDPIYFASKSDDAVTRGKRAAINKLEKLKAETGLRHSDLEVPKEFAEADLAALLRRKGFKKIYSLDYFDQRADLRHDMNVPIPRSQHERYGTLIDIGSIEHVFDTRQCMENCLKMIRVGGVYFLHTCVNGYYMHGLHVFSPEALVKAVAINGFEIEYCKFSTNFGVPVTSSHPLAADANILIWLVARKKRRISKFTCPQQDNWTGHYENLQKNGRPKKTSESDPFISVSAE